MKELLEKIPPEKCWEITAKTLWKFIILSGDKKIGPLLGVGKDIISPLWSKEKWYEITEKIFADGGKQVFPMVKDMFNIPVEDAVGALKLCMVAAWFNSGPEQKFEIVEATPERVVLRTTRCSWWERTKELFPVIYPEDVICPESCKAFNEAGLNAVNHKITYHHIKAMPRGDPYCEEVYEFKEE